MKTREKRFLSVLLAVCMCFSMLPTVVMLAEAADTGLSLSQLRQKFPHGKYWNGGNADSYTSSPCNHHGSCSYSGACGCNSFFGLSIQCMGYAEKLAYDVTGYNPRNNANGWYTYYSSSALNDLKPGDIVRYKNGGHSIYVIGVNGDTVTYTDCNNDGHCIIRWDATISKSTLKSSFTYLRSAPSALSCQTPGKSTITGMQRTYASGSNITFNWTETENTTHYNIWLEVNNDQDKWQRYEQIPYVLSGYKRKLPDGKYRLLIQSYNSDYWNDDGSDWLHTESDYVYFVVGRHDCDKGTNVWYWKAHPHHDCYECTFCGEIWADMTSSNFVSTCITCQMPGKSTITGLQSTYLSGSIIPFTWTATNNTTHYNFWLYIKNDQDEWEEYEHTFYVTSGIQRQLPVGEYRCLIQSYNSDYRWEDGSDWLYTESDYCYFSVVTLESQYPEKAVLDNMKSSYVDSEDIIFEWDETDNTTHYNFWLYIKNNQDEWEEYEHTFYVTSGFARTLPVGEYRCLIQSYNSNYWQEDGSDWLYTESDYCYFEVNQYEYIVNYNANGGSGAPSSQTKYYDMTLTLSSTIPTRPGYTFMGWATDSNATVAIYQPGDSLIDNSDITLYAVWKKGCEGNRHVYDYSITTNPTTSVAGMLTGTCTECEGTTTVILPKLTSTDYTYMVKTVATCTADGTGTYTWKTTIYGSYSFNATLTKTGHSYSNGTCSYCGADDPNDINVGLIGDISGDGRVNMGDVAKLYAHIKGTSILTDETGLDRCDISGDGKVNMGDVAKLYAHIKGTNKLY